MICIFSIMILYCASKPIMQDMISENYNMREEGLAPDEWFWVDRIYYHIYGDYSFYIERPIN